jgi:hypothetical protein
MHSRTRPSCSPSPNSRRRRATPVVQMCRSVPTSAPNPQSVLRHDPAAGLASPAVVAGLSSLVDILHGLVPEARAPRRHRHAGGGLDITRAPLALPGRVPGPRVTELSCRTSDRGPESARAARSQPRSRPASTTAPLISRRLVAVRSVTVRSLANSPRCCNAFARSGSSSSAR